MATSTQINVFFAVSLCFLCLAADAAKLHPAEEFMVEGEVYCEVCRTNFINRLSERMTGATVRLECTGEQPTNVTYSIEGTTDVQGRYHLKAEGDHEDEDCKVTLVKSSRPDCSEVPDEGFAMTPSSKVTITKNSGFHDDIRHANPLGFTKKQADPGCKELFKELQMNPDQLF